MYCVRQVLDGPEKGYKYKLAAPNTVKLGATVCTGGLDFGSVMCFMFKLDIIELQYKGAEVT